MAIYYIVLGDEYYRLTNEQLDPGYPKSLSNVWRGLPDRIDAAFQWYDGKTYFIRDSKYFSFDDFKFEVSVSRQQFYYTSKLIHLRHMA